MEHDICRVNVDLALSRKDAKRLERFLKETGRKRGPYLRQLVLSKLDEYESIEANKTQVDIGVL